MNIFAKTYEFPNIPKYATFETFSTWNNIILEHMQLQLEIFLIGYIYNLYDREHLFLNMKYLATWIVQYLEQTRA